MKKTMKLTYLLTLLLLLFSFTACGEKEDKKADKEDTKVESNKDKDSEDMDSEDKDSEDADSEDKDSEDKDSEDKDSDASSGTAKLGDLTFSVNEEWELDSSSQEGSSLIYMLPSSNGDFSNNFIIQVTDTGTEISEEELKNSADQLIQAYESMNASVVTNTTVDTPVGTAAVFTLDVTKMLEEQGTTGMSAYIKQAVFVNGTNTYIVQLTCASDDFSTLEKEFDDVVSKVSK